MCLDTLKFTSKERFNNALLDHDFIGITETFDESFFAMQLLIELDIEDVMCTSTNVGYEYGMK